MHFYELGIGIHMGWATIFKDIIRTCYFLMIFRLFNLFLFTFKPVVAQSYEVEADNEYVIRGNSAVMKCEVPSFVSDFVVVENWQDSKGNTYLPGNNFGTITWAEFSDSLISPTSLNSVVLFFLLPNQNSLCFSRLLIFVISVFKSTDISWLSSRSTILPGQGDRRIRFERQHGYFEMSSTQFRSRFRRDRILDFWRRSNL